MLAAGMIRRRWRRWLRLNFSDNAFGQFESKREMLFPNPRSLQPQGTSGRAPDRKRKMAGHEKRARRFTTKNAELNHLQDPSRNENVIAGIHRQVERWFLERFFVINHVLFSVRPGEEDLSLARKVRKALRHGNRLREF